MSDSYRDGYGPGSVIYSNGRKRRGGVATKNFSKQCSDCGAGEMNAHDPTCAKQYGIAAGIAPNYTAPPPIITNWYEGQEPAPPPTPACNHGNGELWRTYLGFREAYFYCEKCDAKRMIPK